MNSRKVPHLPSTQHDVYEKASEEITLSDPTRGSRVNYGRNQRKLLGAKVVITREDGNEGLLGV